MRVLRVLPAFVSAMLLVCAGASESCVEKNRVTVATRIIPPYVTDPCFEEGRGNCLSGLSVDLWNKALRPEFVSTNDPGCVTWLRVSSNTEGMRAVQTGDARVFLAGATVTEERKLNNSWVIVDHDGSLALLTNGKADSVGGALSSLAILGNPMTYAAIAGVLLFTLLIGLDTWLMDRLTPPDGVFALPVTVRRGVAAASAAAIRTLLGDPNAYSPTSTASKLWKSVLSAMNVALVGAVAGAAALLVANAGPSFEINGFADTTGHRVAVGSSSSAPAQYMRAHHPFADSVTYDGTKHDLEAMVTDFKAGRVEAIAYDASFLVYVLRNVPNIPPTSRFIGEGGNVGTYATGYATALHDQDALRRLRAGLLGAINSGVLGELKDKYLNAGSGYVGDSGMDTSAAVATLFMWLGSVTPIIFLITLGAAYRRLDKATGPTVTGLAVWRLLWHKVRNTEVWRRERAAFMKASAMRQEDRRRDASMISSEAAVQNIHINLRRILDRLTPLHSDSLTSLDQRSPPPSDSSSGSPLPGDSSLDGPASGDETPTSTPPPSPPPSHSPEVDRDSVAVEVADEAADEVADEARTDGPTSDPGPGPASNTGGASETKEE